MSYSLVERIEAALEHDPIDDFERGLLEEAVILITKHEQRIGKLEEDSIFLNCLRNAGVDNWCGFEFAQEDYQEIME